MPIWLGEESSLEPRPSNLPSSSISILKENKYPELSLHWVGRPPTILASLQGCQKEWQLKKHFLYEEESFLKAPFKSKCPREEEGLVQDLFPLGQQGVLWRGDTREGQA